MSSEKYCIAVIANVEDILNKKGSRLPKRCPTHFRSHYRPEMGATAESGQDRVQWYQKMTGQLKWDIKIGQVDLLFEVALCSQDVALPHEGHLEQVLHIMEYFKEHKKL